MKISARSRYGTRMMLELALHYGKGQILLKDIAHAQEISEKYLSQLVIPLRSAGLVKSFRGANGGYILARPPKQITVKEIVEVLEGDLALAECIKNPGSCARTPFCVTRDLWEHLGMAIERELSSVTLSDLVKRCREKEEICVMYNI